MLQDAKQRQQAINPTKSYIVQAPAGSGKTELLTQRLLKLLASVSQPEEIIAITFTKKAAHEMRERIIESLKLAESEKPQSPHKATTWELATEVIKRDKQLNWDLLNHPNRLKIQTIDSLCQSIVAKTPTLSRNNPYANIEPDCLALYTQAAKECIKYALTTPEYNQVAITLLSHLDNQSDRIIELIAAMLATREQWLGVMIHSRQANRDYFDQCLLYLQQQACSNLINLLTNEQWASLCEISHCICQNIELDSPLQRLNHLTIQQQLSFEQAHALTDLLLTQKGDIRKKFTKKQGFIAPTSIKDTTEKQQAKLIKQSAEDLADSLSQHKEVCNALRLLQVTPLQDYDEDEWNILNALCQLLPMAAAQLQVIFSNHNLVDFSSISQQASIALGDMDAPTDLTLYLDHQIKHLLIDEFQDTSIHQYELIEKLTHGWQPDDGRTLFIVGDPMQSIYRFRQAEVALFLKAKRQGINQITLNSLELSTNFRSTRSIIDWVNNQFSQLFPLKDNPAHGAVSYWPSVTLDQSSDNQAVKAYRCLDKNSQAYQVVDLIKQCQQRNPKASIGILVKNRRQLTEIIHQLKQENLPFDGVDIDNLALDAPILDLWSLTQALTNPADSVAWLALLRSPLAGFRLKDIHQLVNIKPKQLIIDALAQATECHLIEDKQSMLSFYQIMSHALTNRHQTTLSCWVEKTWQSLGGDKIYQHYHDKNIQQYFDLLDKHQHHGSLANTTDFIRQLNSLYSKSGESALIQIMTIHKSKGLEFDCVILPSLNENSGQNSPELIKWMEIATENSPLYLLSGIKSHQQQRSAVYDYITYIDKIKGQFESQRLFYVAATRAKSHLYLLCNKADDTTNSFASMLCDQAFEEQTLVTETLIESTPIRSIKLVSQALKPMVTANANNKVSLSLNLPPQAKIAGTFDHFVLQQLSENQISLNDYNCKQWHARLLEYGINEPDKVIIKTKALLDKLKQSTRAQKLINHQSHGAAELSIIAKEEDKLATYIVDRTFIEDGIRWIIDYKTGKKGKEHDNYIKQLNHYAELFKAMEDKPIKCAIYYPYEEKWHSWDAC